MFLLIKTKHADDSCYFLSISNPAGSKRKAFLGWGTLKKVGVAHVIKFEKLIISDVI